MTMNRTIAIIAALLVALTLAACEPTTSGSGGNSPAQTTSKPKATKPEADASAQAACRHFRNVAGDADILTSDQLIKKLGEVNSSAEASDFPPLRVAARQVLSDVVNGEIEHFAEHAAAMYKACQAVGQ
jgi:hypothetical protein